MKLSLYTLRFSLGLLIFSLLVACTSNDKSSASTKAEINALNLYLDDDTYEIFSFNSVKSESEKRGQFNPGNNMTFSMNTDEDLQGFEYLAYVDDDTVFIMDYADAKITTLTSSINSICGIFPSFSTSQSSFGNLEKQQILIHQPIVTISIQNGGSCAQETNIRLNVEFVPGNENASTTTQINSSLSIGSNISDFDFSSSVIENGSRTTVQGRSGFLGYDIGGQQIQLYDAEGKTIWQTPLPYVDAIPNVRPITSEEVLVQRDNELYVLDSGEMFDIVTLAADVSIPLENALQALFETASYTLVSGDNPIRTVSNRSAFFFEDGDSIYFHPDQNITTAFTRASNTLALGFGISDDNSLILHSIFTDRQLLSIVNVSNPASPVEQTKLQADIIEFHLIENIVYINTLNKNGSSGWQAHWFDTTAENQPFTTYDNSRYIFTGDTREPDGTLLLLSSDETIAGQLLLKPAIYEFDIDRVDGRGIEYGRLNSDVIAILFGSIINDIYGLLSFDTLFDYDDGNGAVNVRETYYFDPTQETSDDNSLKLIKRM